MDKHLMNFETPLLFSKFKHETCFSIFFKETKVLKVILDKLENMELEK